jgi:hypothetical protein
MANEELKKSVAKIMEKELEVYEKWLEFVYLLPPEFLPQEVKNIISRGVSETSRKIRKYKAGGG